MWIMTKQTRVFLFLLILVCVTTSVLGAETRLNITISELISENVTFAQNFYLQEQQNYVLIEGEINVTNPSNNTVFDIYVYLLNTRIFDGNITYESGRNASQFGEMGSFVEYGLVGNTSNNVSLSDDLDNDGSTDFFFVNTTHIIFNLSTIGIVGVPVTDNDDVVTNLTDVSGREIVI